MKTEPRTYIVKGSWSLSWKVALWLLVIQAVLFLLVMTLVVVAVSSADAAPSAEQARTLKSRVYALEQKVRILKANDAAMRSSIGRVAADVAYEAKCLETAVPFSRYGGYVVTDGINQWTEAAFDQTDQGQAPHYWVQVVRPDCMQSYKAASVAKAVSP
jgi:hypothetical protein